MDATDGAFAQWLSQAQIAEHRLTAEQRGLLLSAFAFRHTAATIIIPAVCSVISCSTATPDSKSPRSLAWSASAGRRHRINRRLVQGSGPGGAPPHGRPAHGKLTAALSGPIAEFILTHADATRYDVLDFIERTWGFRVSTVALHHFCKKFGLDRATRTEATAEPAQPQHRASRAGRAATTGNSAAQPAHTLRLPFSRHGRSTRARFLLMPQALDWLATAKQCFADDYGSFAAGLLTSIFSLVIGMERVFHLDDMEDLGFARLCGDRRCPSRYTVGAWRRHLPWYEVDAFCRRTFPWHLLHRQDVMISFDEHTIPRWTVNSTSARLCDHRNKYNALRENCSRASTWSSGRFLCLRGTPGNHNLQRTGGADGPTGVASGPAAHLARAL